MPLADLVIWFANRGVSGALTVERGTTRKTFTIQRGHAIRAASTDPREYFGQFLIHFGLLTEDQLERAFETQRETQVFLGRILVMIGIVPEDQVVSTLHVKISETLLDAFRWTVGRFTFVEQDAESDRAEIPVGVPLLDVHHEGMRRTHLWEQYNKIFVTQHMTLVVHEHRVPAGLTLDTLDGRILALARHNMNIEALALELHATDYQVAARLYELYRLGMLEPKEPSGPLPDPTLTIPPGTLTHADLARQAMVDEDYSGAFRHVQAANLDPGNEELTQLSQQIEGKFREHLHSEIVSKETVPSVLRRLSDPETKRLNPKQRYILARIDGRRTVQAIIQVSPMRDIEALEIIRGFAREGIIRL